MRRCGAWVAVVLVGCAAAKAARSEDLDAAKVQTLSVEQAEKVTFRGDWMRFGRLTDLTAEVAAVLAKREARLEFPLLETPGPGVIEALAANTAGLSFPKLAMLSTPQAQALAGFKGASWPWAVSRTCPPPPPRRWRSARRDSGSTASPA